MPNIQNFASGDLPQGLQAGQQRPQVNFGGPQQPIAQQESTVSKILGQLLKSGVGGLGGLLLGELGGGNVPSGVNPGLQQLQASILKRGAQDAMTRNSPIAQQQVGNQVGANILQNQVIPSGF